MTYLSTSHSISSYYQTILRQCPGLVQVLHFACGSTQAKHLKYYHSNGNDEKKKKKEPVFSSQPFRSLKYGFNGFKSFPFFFFPKKIFQSILLNPMSLTQFFIGLLISSLFFLIPQHLKRTTYSIPRDFLGNIRQQQMGAFGTQPSLCFSRIMLIKTLSVVERAEVCYIFLKR